MSNVVFVDENDNVIGAGTKEEYLRKGIVHRIARVFLFNSKGEILLQKRAATLRAYPGQWDQSVAGHVDEGESYDDAAIREMKEEVGVVTKLHFVGKYYSEEIMGDILKKRFSALYTGVTDADPVPDASEVSEIRWVSRDELRNWIARQEADFTPGAVNAFRYLESKESETARSVSKE